MSGGWRAQLATVECRLLVWTAARSAAEDATTCSALILMYKLTETLGDARPHHRAERKNRQSDRQTGRQTDILTAKLAGIRTDGQTDGLTDRERQTEKQADGHRETL